MMMLPSEPSLNACLEVSPGALREQSGAITPSGNADGAS